MAVVNVKTTHWVLESLLKEIHTECTFARAVTTKFCRTGGLNHRNSLSHSCESWKSEIKVSTTVSLEGSEGSIGSRPFSLVC